MYSFLFFFPVLHHHFTVTYSVLEKLTRGNLFYLFFTKKYPSERSKSKSKSRKLKCKQYSEPLILMTDYILELIFCLESVCILPDHQ